ncbi:hypothetical protein THS27_10000 [Thalassospira sp. MCCC 1A01428]|nr:hypothetical protein THS27_10000 [Thalassospira sp. MCCC 1A01428]
MPKNNLIFSDTYMFILLHEMQQVLRNECCKTAFVRQVAHIRGDKNCASIIGGQNTLMPPTHAVFLV